MGEISKIVKLYTDLQHGDCWVGTNFKETLQGVDAAMAQQNAAGTTNSIWQLVFHVIYWRTTVINRLNGKLDPPPFKDMSLPDVLSEENWRKTLIDFENVYHQLRSTLMHFKEENLDKASPRPEQTYHQLIYGCLQHDAYHLGQIILLKRIAAGAKQ